MRKKKFVKLAIAVMLAVLVLERYLANREAARWHTVAWKPWKEPTYTVQLKRLSPSESKMQAVAFVIMTSSVTKELHLGQLRSWLRDAPHVWAFSDEYDGLFVHTLPSIYGKSTWGDAQHRQLKGMQWLYSNQKERMHGIEWVFLIDDDTWVNMPVFSRILPLLDSNTSLICGYVFENGMFNGGAGMLLSRRAFDTITPRLYTETCPFAGTNDDTVTTCARKSNVTMMHSGMFSFYPAKIESAVDFIEQITVHPVKDYALVEAMTLTSREFFK